MSDKISKMISEAAKKIDKQWEKELGISMYTTTTAEEIPTLTAEKMQDFIDEWFPIFYYNAADYVESGIIYHCKETSTAPEFIVCHPKDLEQLKNTIKHRRLIHISKYLENKKFQHRRRRNETL